MPHDPSQIERQRAASEVDDLRSRQVVESEALPLGRTAGRVADSDLVKLDNWFSYHAPTPDQVKRYAEINAASKALARIIIENCPPSADRTAALRKVRDARMTANASIACGGQ